DAWILPGDRRSGLDLRPRDFRVRLAAIAALGDEVIDSAPALPVTGVPVLYRCVADLRALERDQFHHCGVQLVLVARRCGAAFQVAHVRASVSDEQRALELSGVSGVDAE